MQPGGIAQRWASTAVAHRLLFKEFEDGSVCFDPETGETALLSHLSSFLLEIWAQNAGQPLTRDELLAQVLATDDSATDTETANALVDQALTELHQAGLAVHGTHA